MKDTKLTVRTWLGLGVAWLAFATGASVAQDQDRTKIAAGEQTFTDYCSTCHGDNLISSRQIPDLRRLTATDHSRFESIVLNGKNQMPPWKGALQEQQIEAIWSYIRANAFDK
jgi:mono/diheme cytochrome c family protein